MELAEYQKKTAETAIYNNGVTPPMRYLCWGLIAEVGEVFGVMAKVDRDKQGEWDDEAKEALKKELGDVCWFLSEIANSIGHEIPEILALHLKETVNALLARAFSPWVMRYEPIDLDVEMILAGVTRLGITHGIHIDEILVSNVAKLQSRKKRGVLGGSGDER